MPHLSGYPEKGILQFYIDGNDEAGLMGLNLDDLITQDKFRVLYFENVEEDLSKLKYENIDNEVVSSPLDANANYSIEFFLEKQYMTISDYRFHEMSFSKDMTQADLDSEERSSNEDDCSMIDAYYKKFSGEVHRIGGYPFFTQADPRDGSKNLQEYELLLQLATDYSEDKGVSIMWGDAGVGAFFIRPEDLKKCNFTNVLYNWDCC